MEYLYEDYLKIPAIARKNIINFEIYVKARMLSIPHTAILGYCLTEHKKEAR